MYSYRFQIWLAWLVVPYQFYWQVPERIAETNLFWVFGVMQVIEKSCYYSWSYWLWSWPSKVMKQMFFGSKINRTTWISNQDVQANRSLILIFYIIWMLRYINCYIESDCWLKYISIQYTGFTLLDNLCLIILEDFGNKV